MKIPGRNSIVVVAIVGGLAALPACGEVDDSLGDELVQTQGEVTFVNYPGTSSPFLYDGGTACSIHSATHCCPPGMAMTGAHLGANVFKCATVGGGFLPDQTYIDAGADKHVRNNMHACKVGWVMIGFRRGGQSCGFLCQTVEFLICAKPAVAIHAEYVDSTSQDSLPMHVCREDVVNPQRFVMSGIHDGQNKFTCAR
jgi:hypothetical protein